MNTSRDRMKERYDVRSREGHCAEGELVWLYSSKSPLLSLKELEMTISDCEEDQGHGMRNISNEKQKVVDLNRRS